jgi:hypothetical protein
MSYRYKKLGLGSPMKTAVKRAHFSCRAPVPLQKRSVGRVHKSLIQRGDRHTMPLAHDCPAEATG